MTDRAPAWERTTAPPRDEVRARWRGASLHSWPLVALAYLSVLALPATVHLEARYWLAWAGLATVSFGFFVLSRWSTEVRAEVLLTRTHAYVRYRSGVVERIALDGLRGAEQVTRPERRWVFRFGPAAPLTLPDYRATRALVEALRAAVPVSREDAG
jgi:hypothetical protein